ncbi:MAG: acetate--CoA ligase family protein [Thermodesulfobacteriota bacterium]|nr:acetate--CoA ligase family protein [Thermodesulfobacteriota bacterium]
MRQADFGKDIDILFNPQTIAIIGASVDPGKPAGHPVLSLIENGFKGGIYPVNPKYTEVGGLKCYPLIEDVPGEVDLAIIAVPAKRVAEVLHACIRKKVKAVIILTSGFAEAGSHGREMQDEIVRLTRENGILLCGPNSQGIFNTLNGMSAGFAITKLAIGDDIFKFYGFISQSGGFGTSMYIMSSETGIGFTYFVSSGNEASLGFSDYLFYMLNDENTKAVGGYLEGVKDGRKLFNVADMALAQEKPLILIKSGRHAAAAKAAASHTGALVGSDSVYASFFHQKAIIRVEGIEELNAVLSVLAAGPLPKGNRIAVVASSGGSGVLVSDKCVSAGLEVVPLAQDTRKKLDAILPSFGSSANPVDATSQILVEPDLFLRCLKIVLDDPNIDMVICEQWPGEGGGNSGYLKALVEASRATEKVLMVFTLGLETIGAEEVRFLRANRVPVARSQDFAVRVIGRVAQYAERLRKINKAKSLPMSAEGIDKNGVKRLLDGAGSGQALSESLSKQILSAYGIPCVAGGPAKSPDEALKTAYHIGFPVALKIDSPDIKHKTEAGGVRLNINNDRELLAAFKEVMENAVRYNSGARINGVLVQKMLGKGIECIVGMKNDEVFGPTVLFGLGGVFVEALEDVSLRVCPLSPLDVREMVAEIRGHRILSSFRGAPSADKDAVYDVLLRVSQLAMDFPEIKEMDINPLTVFPKGALAADALIITKTGV